MTKLKIIAYRYGPYTFGVTKNQRISALCSQSFKNEKDLLDNYDKAIGCFSNSPPVFRVYANGTEKQLRPRKE